MTEPQDFESLDELFRKTFDNLPETPSKSGWDRPSDRVWQHVQATVQPPKSGWSAKAITLVSALAVTVVIGLYLFVSRPVQPTETPATTQQPAIAAPSVEIPVATETVVAVPSTATSVPKKQTATRNIRKPQNLDNSPRNSTIEAPVEHQRSSGSIPLPGSKAIAPNNTIDKLEQLWQTPLEPLPVLPENVERDGTIHLN